MHTNRLNLSSRVLAAFCLTLASGLAMAFVAPQAGDFGFDVYDIVINKIVNGPIGFAAAGALLLFGVTQLMKSWLITLGSVVAATVIIQLDNMIQTLGFVI